MNSIVKTGDRIVMCMKWGKLFPPDYVNVLYNACRKNITESFRFVCLTDDSVGFSKEVEVYPIPDIGLTETEWYTKGVWPKLAIYTADLHGLKGRCLFIDLDMVVVGSLDALFEHPSRFVCADMGDSWRPGGGLAPSEAGTCIFAFNLGEEAQILEGFMSDRKGTMKRYRNEQDYVSDKAHSIDFWPEGWIVSFKRHLRQPIGLDLFRSPKYAPSGAKVIAFHGDPRPIKLIPANAGFWDRFPHMGHGQVRWMRDYWLQNGGRLPPF